MEEAGAAISRRMIQHYKPGRVAVLCGKGNNAGDGLVAARHLYQNGVDVTAFCLENENSYAGAAAGAFQKLKNTPVPIVSFVHPGAEGNQADAIVDALLGTGMKGPARDKYASAIDNINHLEVPILSADIPSGLREIESGEQLGPVVNASMTVTIGCPKSLLLQHPGYGCIGNLVTERINFPPELLDSSDLYMNWLEPEYLAEWLPKRPPDSNKGTFGNVGIIAGSAPYAGAAALVAKAALRSGCGLTTIFAPASLNSIYKILLPEAISHLVPSRSGERFDDTSTDEVLSAARKLRVLAVGPGLGTKPETRIFLEKLIFNYSGALILDADALNILSHGLVRLLSGKSDCLITPHPGEMARLADKGVSEVQADRVGTAREFAQKHQVHLLLKGASTVVARPDGQVWIVPGSCPTLAKGGTGDVLTGHIASLVAQGMPVYKAAILGAQVHLNAGHLAARKFGKRGALASEVADCLSHALDQLEANDKDSCPVAQQQ